MNKTESLLFRQKQTYSSHEPEA